MLNKNFTSASPSHTFNAHSGPHISHISLSGDAWGSYTFIGLQEEMNQEFVELGALLGEATWGQDAELAESRRGGEPRWKVRVAS